MQLWWGNAIGVGIDWGRGKQCVTMNGLPNWQRTAKDKDRRMAAATTTRSTDRRTQELIEWRRRRRRRRGRRRRRRLECGNDGLRLDKAGQGVRLYCQRQESVAARKTGRGRRGEEESNGSGREGPSRENQRNEKTRREKRNKKIDELAEWREKLLGGCLKKRT